MLRALKQSPFLLTTQRRSISTHTHNNPFVHVLGNGLRVIDHTPFLEASEGEVDVAQSKKWVADAVAEACMEIGCFYVTGEGVLDQEVITKAREDARLFFSLPSQVKWCHTMPYFQRGFAKLNENNRSIYPNDHLESYVMGPPVPNDPYYSTPEAQLHFVPNIWPK